jgi:hypothetical protein
MDINHEELLARLMTGTISQQEYDLAVQTHNDRVQLCVNSVLEVTYSQEEAVKDLVWLVKTLHDPSTSISGTVEKEELDGFLNLVVSFAFILVLPPPGRRPRSTRESFGCFPDDSLVSEQQLGLAPFSGFCLIFVLEVNN